MLYQLSYFRKNIPYRSNSPSCARRPQTTSGGFATPTGFLEWEVMDSNHRRRTPADLQSAPFDRSGNFPFFLLRGDVVPPGLSDQGSVFIADSAFKSSEAHSPLLFSTSPALSLGPLASAFRADGGIRTPDQLITNQLLWPTELHRQNQPFWIAKVGIKN